MNAIRRIRGRFCVLILGAVATQACGDSPSAAPQASARAQGETLERQAEVYTVVAPAVVVRDADGRATPGTRVTFQVMAGGGTMESSTVTTDASGRAEARWRLGESAGENTVTARIGPVQTVTFTVQGVAGAPATIAAVVMAPEVAPVSGAVGVVPAVRVTDRFGNGVAEVPVDFRAVRGGGTVSGGTAVTDVGGVASPGSWMVGATQGENELVATAQGLPPVSFTTRAVAVSSEWLHLSKFAGDGTTCPTTVAGCRFSVRVSDLTGSPVAGETVLWTGPGGVTSTTMTNALGLSTSPNLGVRTPGPYTMTARLMAASEEAVFEYRVVNGGGFNIDLRFVNDVSPGVRAAFESARQRWQEIITGNLPEFSLTGANQVAANACGINHPAVNEVVDDILIFAEVVPIDGPGKVLGSAGPCYVRGSSGLPILGVIKLDADDLEVMERNGTLRDVILHEIGHVLGIGTLWNRHSLVRGAGTSDPYYVGVRASPGFVLGGGSIINGIPVENTGGTGTRDSHWRESRLGNELMTGYISGSHNPISFMTVGSLMDVGYQVNFGAADPYMLPGMLGGMGLDPDRIHLHEVPLPAPRALF
jgi:hypothetical protein